MIRPHGTDPHAALAADPDTALGAALVLDRWMAEREYRGWDPFDALASPLLRGLSLGTLWGGVAWTQLLKRSPLGVRVALGVPRLANAKGLALALQAHLRLERVVGGEDGQRHRARARALLGRIADARHPSGGWGYPFPWANREFRVAAGTPSSVVTAFVGRALLEARDAGLAVEDAWLEGAGRFLAEDLVRIPGEGGFCFSYTPRDRRAVHNASALAASLLALLSRELDRPEWGEAALGAARFTARAQREDGSWIYGLAPGDGWIDPYHTGYTLRAFRAVGRGLRTTEFDQVVARGFDFWRQAFLVGPAVGPRPGHSHPVGLHAVADGVLTLLTVGGDDAGCRAEAGRLVAWALEHGRGDDGAFHHRVHRGRVDGRLFMRWVQAWMLLALAEAAEAGVGPATRV